jgi:hypothetical protein
MEIEKFSDTFIDSKVYGFMVYNRSGNSLPKGMISYYKVVEYGPKQVHIQWSVQSGSEGADASDHYNFSMPVSTFERGKAMVDMYFIMVHSYIYEIDNVL